MAYRSEREQGFALVLVFWMVAVLAVLVATFSHLVGSQARIARNQYDHARAKALADAGVSLAILGLLDRAKDTSWRLDGSLREFSYDGGTIRIRLQDESGKLDLNQVRPDILANLFRVAAKVDEEECIKLAGNFSSWRSDRLSAWRRSDSGPVPISIGPFLAVEEILEVTGISREIFEQVKPFLTVWSGSSKVDPLSAPIEVLLSLPGGNPRQIENYVTMRGKYGPDPNILPALPGLGSYLNHQGAAVYVSVESSAIAVPAGGFTRDATISLLAAGDQRYRFVSWREGGSAAP